MKKINFKNIKLDIGFNKKLYLDGIRQLKLVGIMGLVVLCAAAVLTATGYHINTPSYWVDGFGNTIARPAQGLSLYSAHWALFITFPVLVPVMTMMLFNFLNHRNASDFYHAIPDTRGTLYISYMASILTWIGAIIGISTALSIFCVSILPGYYIIWSGVPKALFLIIAACVLVMGGISIALGLTGTRMSNLLVTLIVLFLPRFFVTMIMHILGEMMPFVEWRYSSSLFNPRYNLIAGLPLALFSSANPFGYGSSGVYSLILGLIYLVAGHVIFLRRKSESAGHAAISRRMQSIFRLSVSLMICLLPMYSITSCWANSDIMDGDELFIVLVFYVIAVLAYFIYELMTTGKLRAFKKLCKGIGVLAIGNVILFLMIIGIYASTIKNTPEAEDIDYVMLNGDERDYFEAQLQRIRLRDEEVAEITARALRRTVEYYRNGRRYPNGSHFETITKTVAINEGLRTIYREVRYTTAEWNTIVDYLSRQPEYYLVYCDLPEFDPTEMSIYTNWGYFSTEQLVRIYEVMREEVRTANVEEWYTAVTGYHYGTNYVDTINLTLEVGSSGYRDTIRLPILTSLTETVKYYWEEQNAGGLGDRTKENWLTLVDMIDGEMKNGQTANYLSISYQLSLIKGSNVLDGIDGYIEGSQSEEAWKLATGGLKEEALGSFETFMEKLVENEYGMETTGGTLVMIELYGSGAAYDQNGKWTDINETHRTYISLPDPIPEEIEDWLGEVLIKLNQK
ncbi:MAG: hypothetical protein IJA58_01570 [Lachnospiraceae bacterium]|nr:hypothetical protein [Lachnospiraceae bacterium]